MGAQQAVPLLNSNLIPLSDLPNGDLSSLSNIASQFLESIISFDPFSENSDPPGTCNKTKYPTEILTADFKGIVDVGLPLTFTIGLLTSADLINMGNTGNVIVILLKKE